MKTVKKAKNPDFQLITNSFLPDKSRLHIYNKHVICITDSKGYSQPDNKNPMELRLDATNGIIPMWHQNVTLNWRFSKSFGSYFKKPEEAKQGIRNLLAKAITAWQDSCPVKFHEDNDVWDFEIAMHQEDCDSSGCVLASAFFPGPGQNTFYIYPTMFQQDEKEQIETLEHEIGHVFGLRHFFANLETGYPSVLFGTDNALSIMNYGPKSTLTAIDIQDLKTLYTLVWSGQLTEINGTKIELFKPYHTYRHNSTLRLQPGYPENSKPFVGLVAKYYADISGLALTDGAVGNEVKKAILIASGRYRPNPDSLDNDTEMADFDFSDMQVIDLTDDLNEIIISQNPDATLITISQVEGCEKVQDCIDLVITLIQTT